MTRNDLYATITAAILADMERGVLPWERGHTNKNRPSLSLPFNASSLRPYRGINILLLWNVCKRRDMDDMRFLTFKQAVNLGGTVKSGEHGHAIYFWQFPKKEDAITHKEKTIPLLKKYTVFHVDQTEGCNFPAINLDAPVIPEDTGEFIAALNCHLEHGGNQPCYIPALDIVRMPYPQDFLTMDNYRTTLYHEISHWTGHTSRLKRDHTGSFGSISYAKEELVAELAASFLYSEFGLPYTTRHASYLKSWIAVLKDDNTAIMKAASAAQKACDYIHSVILGNSEVLEEQLAA